MVYQTASALVRCFVPDIVLQVIQNPTRKFDTLDLFKTECFGLVFFQTNDERIHLESIWLKSISVKSTFLNRRSLNRAMLRCRRLKVL